MVSWQYVFAQLLAQFHLGLAVLFDFGVRKLDRFKHLGFRNLFHFAFDHQDVVVGGAYHDVQVGVGILREGGIDHQLAVNAGNAHLGDRAGERHVRYGQRRRSGPSAPPAAATPIRHAARISALVLRR